MKRTISMLLATALLLPLFGCAAVPAEQGVSEPSASFKPEPSPAPLPELFVEQLAAPVLTPVAPEEALTLPDGTKQFWQAGIAEFLSGAGEDNRLFSPVNVYLALAMLAETTDGNSRSQLLSLLGADSIEALRTQAQALWQSCRVEDEDSVILPGSSMWLRNDIPYHAETLQNLADCYYAAAFSGQMGDPAYNLALQSWINENTGNLMTEQTQGLEMNVNTVLALVTTLYFKAPWEKQFSRENTETDVFHAANGDLNCAFLREDVTCFYYQGENFTAIGKPLANAGTMYFLLPSEGVSPEALLQDPQALAFLSGDLDAVEGRNALVHFWLPKFDVSSQLGLIDGLKALGVTDVFDESVADFSPLTAAVRDLYVSQAEHGVRVKVDEEGCEAAAYTMITIETKMARPVADEVDFFLDRPFLFGVLTYDSVPLFTGIVNQP